jgi:uncharacterized flavoprotein (TIGR03862 family)
VTSSLSSSSKTVAIIGAGPAGLMAAEVLSAAGVAVHVYDAMPSVGRKFLLAGLGGLNLTHAEPFAQFITRYGERQDACAAWLKELDANAIRDWVKGLGLDTFVGTSQRVFPTDMKAAPLLRAWLHRLRHPTQGEPVSFHMRHRWNGALTHDDSGYTLTFDTPQGPHTIQAHAVLLALGGGSWAKLGSDGAWQSWLRELGLDVAPLRPSNCGFDVQGGWSAHLRDKFAGSPIKGAVLSFKHFSRKGEFVLTSTGIEGSLVYAVSPLLRDVIAREHSATLHIDLKPEFSAERILAEVRHPRGSRSLSSHLKSRLNLSPVHLALLHEVLPKEAMNDAAKVASTLKALPLTLSATRPMDEAISTAGGVKLEALTPQLMSHQHPGLFMAGEMLDWEAPTGGYLLSACLASGRVAGLCAARYCAMASMAMSMRTSSPT